MSRRLQTLVAQRCIAGGQQLDCQGVVAPWVQIQHLKQQPDLQMQKILTFCSETESASGLCLHFSQGSAEGMLRAGEAYA